MRNLEAKFRIHDLAAARHAAEAIGFAMRAELVQRDTFFRVAAGRLKLREEADSAALIRYSRTHQGALEASDYEIVPVVDPVPLRTMLAAALGVLAEVRKERWLLMRRNVRLHLDRIKGLGTFGEIEAVAAIDEPLSLYHTEVAEVLAALGIDPGTLLRESYFELAREG